MSSTPPPFSPESAAPRPPSGTSPVIWIVAGFCLFCVIAIVAAVFMMRGVVRSVTAETPCLATQSVLINSVRAYVEEKGQFPPAETWQEELLPYYETERDEMMKELDEVPMLRNTFRPIDLNALPTCSTGVTKTFLVYNSDVAGKKIADLPDGEETVIFFEDTTGDRNAHASYVEKDDATSPRMMGESRGWYKLRYNDEATFSVDGSTTTTTTTGTSTDIEPTAESDGSGQ